MGKTREQLLNELEVAENELQYIKEQKKKTAKTFKEDMNDVEDKISNILKELEELKVSTKK
jgi:hypothetical protein